MPLVRRAFTCLVASAGLTMAACGRRLRLRLRENEFGATMPTYEYECEKCGHHFDRFQSMTEPPVRRCPACRGKVKRVPGVGAGIIFKGSGFYATDYRSPTYRSQQKQDSEGAGSAGKREEKATAAGEKGKAQAVTTKTK
jgi:putative FmdB family regulatory protein